MAHGSIASMRTGGISVVPSLAAAVPAVTLDAADHHLDGEHYPYLLRLASARTWTSVVSSWLDNAAGIRMRGRGRCNSRFAPDHTIGHRVKVNAAHAVLVSKNLSESSNTAFVSFH
jgi:hypothetical protein